MKIFVGFTSKKFKRDLGLICDTQSVYIHETFFLGEAGTALLDSTGCCQEEKGKLSVRNFQVFAILSC